MRDEAVQAAYEALNLKPTSLDSIDGAQVQLDAVIRVFIPAGEYDAAIEELDAYLNGTGGLWSIEGLVPDPRLDPIRDDPRFVALVEKYKRQ